MTESELFAIYFARNDYHNYIQSLEDKQRLIDKDTRNYKFNLLLEATKMVQATSVLDNPENVPETI
jgi:hypothetical protein